MTYYAEIISYQAEGITRTCYSHKNKVDHTSTI